MQTYLLFFLQDCKYKRVLYVGMYLWIHGILRNSEPMQVLGYIEYC